MLSNSFWYESLLLIGELEVIFIGEDLNLKYFNYEVKIMLIYFLSEFCTELKSGLHIISLSDMFESLRKKLRIKYLLLCW